MNRVAPIEDKREKIGQSWFGLVRRRSPSVLIRESGLIALSVVLGEEEEKN